MREVTTTTTLYSFNELSDKAKQTAIEDYSSRWHEYAWSDDYVKTLETFASQFPVRIRDYQVSPYADSYISLAFTDDEHEDMCGARLRAHLLTHYFDALYEGKYYGKLVDTYPDGTKIEKSKEYPIGKRHVKRHSKVMFDKANPTGFCADYDVRKPIYEFLANGNDTTTTFGELMYSCASALKMAWCADMAYQDSAEYLAEELIANDYEFTSDGKLA